MRNANKCPTILYSATVNNNTLFCNADVRPCRTWAFQRTHYSTSKIQDGRDPPSWILTPKCKNKIFRKTEQFRAMVSIDVL